jgi:hypothetical protein
MYFSSCSGCQVQERSSFTQHCMWVTGMSHDDYCTLCATLAARMRKSGEVRPDRHDEQVIPIGSDRYPLPATRYPLPATRYLIPATCYPMPATRYLLPATCFLLPATCYPLPATRHLLPATCYPLPATRYPLPATRYLLPATCYPLPAPCYPLPATRYLLPAIGSCRSQGIALPGYVSSRQTEPSRVKGGRGEGVVL